MNLDTQLAGSLKELFRQEPALVQELTKAENLDQTIDQIAAAANRHGISLDAAEREALSAAIARQAQLLSTLQDLITKDESLAQTLRTIEQPEQAVEAIMDAANRHGVALDANELAPHLQHAFKTGAPEELSDDALSDVTGGLLFSLIATGALIVASAITLAGAAGGLGALISNMIQGKR